MKRAEGDEPAAGADGKGAAVISGLLVIVLAMFTAGMLGGSALAKADVNANDIKELEKAENLLPLEEVMDKAKALRAGQLIEAELKAVNGQDIYEIEILDEDGKVWEMNFDAKTGVLITQGEEKKHENPGR